MTLDTCATFCAGYKYFGTEYSTECYCGNALVDGSALVDTKQCSMLCGGDSKTFCGAGDRLTVYQLAAVPKS